MLSEYFGATTDELLLGNKNTLESKSEGEIQIDEALSVLLDKHTLIFDGRPISDESIESLLSAFEIISEQTKRKEREKREKE